MSCGTCSASTSRCPRSDGRRPDRRYRRDGGRGVRAGAALGERRSRHRSSGHATPGAPGRRPRRCKARGARRRRSRASRTQRRPPPQASSWSRCRSPGRRRSTSPSPRRWTRSKVVIDCTVPVAANVGGKVTHTLGVWEGSAAQQAQSFLPKGTKMYAAFHSLAAVALNDLEERDGGGRARVRTEGGQGDDRRTGPGDIPSLRFVDAGPLENARIVEPITALLIGINHRYKTDRSGVRITGIAPIAPESRGETLTDGTIVATPRLVLASRRWTTPMPWRRSSAMARR